MSLKSFISILILTSSLNSAFGQSKISENPFTTSALIQKHTFIQKKAGHIYRTIATKDSIHVMDIDLTEMIDVIVEFKDEPLFILQKRNILNKISPAAFQTMQVKFTSDLSRVYQNVNKTYSAVFNVPQKTREYYKLFNGTSITIPKAMLPEIASLDYVKKVHPNKRFKINLNESVKVIGADQVWSKYNDKGDSIVVGILDTGIDYLHPALGRGFGKGYKVIGGYDIVNKDNDPMDDNGHGTHVAGIVAADGDSIKGVAPKAFLMAFKVLSYYGGGSESDIIAGIERAVDPNDDNNFNDKVDIANMSLGGPGSPDDAISTAVDNAVRLGVVFCVSAGNDGNDYDIGSPAAASLAITVGASEKNDQFASYSSRGPARVNYSIKPEILAPGTMIKSSFPNNQYQILSGTSMASPHVAGICALIKHMYKNWTPEMIKSALVTSSKDLNLDIMSQGAGRADALKAVNVGTSAVPSTVSFGLDDADIPQWNKKENITITNNSNQIQSYNITITGLKTGINLVSDFQFFSLLPGQSQTLTFTLTVNNSIVPFLGTKNYSYNGMINIKGGRDEMHLPWAFTKAPLLSLHYDIPVLSSSIYNKSKFISYVDYDNKDGFYSYERLIPPGKYNMQFLFASVKDITNGTGNIAFVVKEGVDISGNKNLFINSTDAINKIEYMGTDENGRLLSSLKNSEKNICFIYKDSSYYTFLDFNSFPPGCSIKTSAIPNSFSLLTGQFQKSINDEKKIRIINYPVISGLYNSIQLKNNYRNFLTQNINTTLRNDMKNTDAVFSNVFYDCFDTGNSWGSMMISSITYGDLITSKNWSGTLYITPPPEKESGFSTAIITDLNSRNYYDKWFCSDIFRSSNDSTFCFKFLNPTPDIFVSPNNGTFNFGDGAIYPVSYTGMGMINTSYRLFLGASFYGQLNEERMSDELYSTFELYDSQNKLIASDLLKNKSYLDLSAGNYNVIIRNNHYLVSGVKGKAALTAELDTKNLANPLPAFTSLKVLNSRRIPVSRFEQNEKGNIVFSITGRPFVNDYDTSATKLFLKNNNSGTWEEVKIIKMLVNDRIGPLYKADIGKFTDSDSAAIDMKITLKNKTGNKTEWILSPSFTVGNFKGPDDEEDNNEIPVIPAKYAFYNNYPNPFNPVTTISYDLPNKSNVELKIYDILGHEIATLVDKEQEAGKYSIKFDGNNLSSGIYIYKIRAGNYSRIQKMILVK